MARNPKNTRMCAACRTRGEKDSFFRIAKTATGIQIATGSIEGRSVYLCKKKECLDMAIKKKSLSRSLKCEIPSEITDTLFTELDKKAETE